MGHDIIHHFGPDPSHVGGMGSVIRVLVEHHVGGDSVEMHPTWVPRSTHTTARLTLKATASMVRMRPREVAHVHLSERGSFVREGALVALARRRKLVPVVTIHGAAFLPFAESHPRLTSAVLRQARLVTCLDQEVLEAVGRAAPRVRADILPNPIMMDYSAPTADRTDEIVVFAGEIGLRKGADILYEAWELVAKNRPEARCLMVGPGGDFNGPAVERLETQGPVDTHEMREILRAARVVVLPSRAEGMPMILTEAMAGGRPFVSTPVGGIPDLAREGAGVLVDVGDHVGLAQALTNLLADRELARSMGERGQAFCSETRSAEIIDARLRDLYAAAASDS